jgi:hypothetical protein
MTLRLPPDSRRRLCATSAARDLSAATCHRRRDDRGHPLASSLGGVGAAEKCHETETQLCGATREAAAKLRVTQDRHVTGDETLQQLV